MANTLKSGRNTEVVALNRFSIRKRLFVPKKYGRKVGFIVCMNIQDKENFPGQLRNILFAKLSLYSLRTSL